LAAVTPFQQAFHRMLVSDRFSAYRLPDLPNYSFGQLAAILAVFKSDNRLWENKMHRSQRMIQR
jgi:hypothetical protein